MSKKLTYHLVFFLFIFIFSAVLGNGIKNTGKDLDNKDKSEIKISSNGREISFSGYNWTVRTSAGETQGPGPNYFSNSEENVWLDENGYLHLKITKNDSKWYCAEIYSHKSFGYGTYNFKLAPGFQDLDKNVILGLFTYLDDKNEIDIEFAKWGNENAKLGQFVVQPYSNLGNLHRFEFPEIDKDSVHGFTWCEGYIKFYSAINSEFDYDEENLVENWFYTGDDNPEPSSERVHMNLWLMDGNAPSDKEETEIVIEAFEFKPSNCNDTIPFPPWIIWAIIIGVISLSGIGIFLYIRKKK